MIKGVNKVIIEVNETNNEVFEKAILYVRPEYCRKNGAKLETKARNYVDNAFCDKFKPFNSYEESIKRRRRFFLIIGGYLVVLAVVLYLIFF